MHALVFATKRAHIRTVELGKALLAPHGLTPARFDLMYLVDRAFAPAGHRQDWLVRELGCSPATASRMLRSLEALGYVKRTIDWMDRRRRLVHLTAEGFRRVREAAHDVLNRWRFQTVYEAAMLPPPPRKPTPREARLARLTYKPTQQPAPPPPPDPPRKTRRKLNVTRKWLMQIARGLGDTSSLKYPLFIQGNPTPPYFDSPVPKFLS
jgi:DNA-binding MarR family transcriptional regulator